MSQAHISADRGKLILVTIDHWDFVFDSCYEHGCLRIFYVFPFFLYFMVIRLIACSDLSKGIIPISYGSSDISVSSRFILHYATSRKVGGSIPDDVIGFFN
jgi:hypothetical protein